MPAATATPASPLPSPASDEAMAVASPVAATPRRADDIPISVQSASAPAAAAAPQLAAQATRRDARPGNGQTLHAQPGIAVHTTAGTASPAVSHTVTDNTPRLTIGRIDVLVLAPPAAPARNVSSQSDAAFLSKHYLRRL
ncbi:hypothetical protein [Chitinimonas naiadis]